MICLAAGVVATMVIVLIVYPKYKESCFGGNGKDCYSRFVKYEKYGLPEAGLYASKACELGVYEGCIKYANLAEAKGDVEHARDYLYLACQMKNEGCNEQASFELSIKNSQAAIVISDRSCNVNNDPEGCYWLGVSYFYEENSKDGLPYLVRSCHEKVGKACYVLASYFHDIGDDHNYQDNLEKACEYGVDKACSRLLRE